MVLHLAQGASGGLTIHAAQKSGVSGEGQVTGWNGTLVPRFLVGSEDTDDGMVRNWLTLFELGGQRCISSLQVPQG